MGSDALELVVCGDCDFLNESFYADGSADFGVYEYLDLNPDCKLSCGVHRREGGALAAAGTSRSVFGWSRST